MKLILDTANQTLAIQEKDATRTCDLYSDEAFTVLVIPAVGCEDEN